jgi:hypothetical protein
MNFSKMLILTLVLIAAFGFMKNGRAAVNEDFIELEVIASDTKVKIRAQSGPGKVDCRNSLQKGCVKVPKGDTAEIKFDLEDSSGWSFSRMQLVPGGNAAKFDFDELGKPLSGRERRDFSVAIRANKIRKPDSDGIINLKTVGDSFILYNNNVVKQTYGYQIEVCPDGKDSGDPACLTSDPKIDNEGHN